MLINKNSGIERLKSNNSAKFFETSEMFPAHCTRVTTKLQCEKYSVMIAFTIILRERNAINNFENFSYSISIIFDIELNELLKRKKKEKTIEELLSSCIVKFNNFGSNLCKKVCATQLLWLEYYSTASHPHLSDGTRSSLSFMKNTYLV